MSKSLTYHVFWFLLLLLLQIQTGNGSSEESATCTGTNMKKLKIGVPKRHGFHEIVNVLGDPRKNEYNVSGYCIDVFNEVLKVLCLNVSVDYEPYVDEYGQSAGTYDSLLEQIPKKRYDAVVGDVTITAKRSKYVDFTLPYTEAGVSMIQRVQPRRHLSMWIFVKPFSWDLWLGIAIASIFIGIVILIMERNVNSLPADGSPLRKQLALTILWFPLLQAVLPERQGVAKNCSRFVLMVWLLLAFVLMQSYTASLTSMTTLDQLQPRFLSANDLKEGGYYVGRQNDTFVRDLLVQGLKIDPGKIRVYSKTSEYRDALQLGSRGGGVDAIFAEVPYLKVFLKIYGTNYMMAGPTYRRSGFGFAFPLNSNLTSLFSRAILIVTESDIMDLIEEKYFGKNDAEQEQSGQTSSNTTSLTSYSFAGLFLIAGIATLLALLVSESVIWRRPILMATDYSRRYMFRTRRSRETSVHSRDDISASTTHVDITEQADVSQS